MVQAVRGLSDLQDLYKHLDPLQLHSSSREKVPDNPHQPGGASSQGKSYLFTNIDRNSRWFEAVSVSSTTYAECALALVNNWISRYGMPDAVQTRAGRSSRPPARFSPLPLPLSSLSWGGGSSVETTLLHLRFTAINNPHQEPFIHCCWLQYCLRLRLFHKYKSSMFALSNQSLQGSVAPSILRLCSVSAPSLN